jgi:phenylacetate-CoA ligase
MENGRSMPKLCLLEILDENGTVLREKANYDTSLFNRLHPFIRYDIGDIGILDEKSTITNLF